MCKLLITFSTGKSAPEFLIWLPRDPGSGLGGERVAELL